MEVYLDNAATTKIKNTVLQSMYPYFESIYGNPSSLHNFGQMACEALYDARMKIARVINSDTKEIIFTASGSESDNQAIISASKIGITQRKRKIITSKIEHHAVLDTVSNLEKQGFEASYLDVDENGLISLEELSNIIDDKTCLVSIMFANNEIGTIQPISDIGKICKLKNVLFHTDAVQALGHVDIDVKDMNIDFMSGSAHKFHGPKGVGLLYFKKDLQIEKIIQGGAQERNYRAGTENVPSIVGMASALEYSLNNLSSNETKLKLLQKKLIDGLSLIPHSILNGDRYSRLSNNVNFSFEGIEGESLLLLLNDKGIYASSGSACTSGSLNASHVLLSIGRDKEIARGSIRLTMSDETTQEEIDYTIKCVNEVVAYLRNMSPLWQELKKGTKEYKIK